MYRIDWERYDNPGVMQHGPPLYITSFGKKVPATKKEAEALAKSANNHFKEGIHKAVKIRIRRKQDLKPNPFIRT